MKKQCDHCGLAFDTKRQDAKFCGNACRTSAHRKRHGLPEPTFLAPSVPVKASNLSGVANSLPRLGRAVRLLKAVNPAWQRARIELAQLEGHYEGLQQTRKELFERYNAIVTKNPGLKEVIAVAAGAWAADSTKNDIGKIIGGITAGFLGYHIGSGIDSMLEDKTEIKRKKQELVYIEKRIEIIDKELFNTGTVISIKRSDIKKINQYIEQNEEIIQPIINNTIEEKQLKTNKNIKIMATNDISGMEFETFSFDNEWSVLFGEPEYGFSMAIYGKPGAGKSTFALKFAHYLAENKGKVLFVSSEEGISKSIRDKINRLNIQSKYLNIASECNDENKLIELLISDKYPFVFLDSINHMRITVEEMEQIKKRFPKTAFVLIFQTTKAGDMKGSQEYAHNCDIVVRIENQTATTQKNRYSDLTALPLSTSPSLLEPSIKNSPTKPE